MDDKKEKRLIKKREREMASVEERLRVLHEARRARGLITKFPISIPPPDDPDEDTILSITFEDQDKLLEDLLSRPEKLIVIRDIYPWQAHKPDEPSLPEVDNIARELLHADGEYPIRKKKRVVSVGKQKKEVASSSKRPMTNA